MIMSEMCFGGRKTKNKMYTASLDWLLGVKSRQNFLGQDAKSVLGCLRSDGENILFSGVKGVGGEPLDQ